MDLIDNYYLNEDAQKVFPYSTIDNTLSCLLDSDDASKVFSYITTKIDLYRNSGYKSAIPFEDDSRYWHFESQKNISRHLASSIKKVKVALDILKQHNLIEVRTKGNGSINYYTISDDGLKWIAFKNKIMTERKEDSLLGEKGYDKRKNYYKGV